ncbi:hypothetical protein SCUCBS95973_009356 [Sporothrix curviconia]|uniref:Uncharacterized protein n=1 Tax=Sporothrix curviconia TaxID=1260050 RepID=A0ABP0CXH5_9PEZI
MSTTTTTAPATVLANIQDPDDTKNVYYQSGGYRLLRPVLIGAQVKRTFDAIPTVDVSNIFSPDLNVRKAIAAEVGFFYASNPPVPFFRLPQDELLQLHVDNSQGVKGYLPFTFRDGRR